MVHRNLDLAAECVLRGNLEYALHAYLAHLSEWPEDVEARRLLRAAARSLRDQRVAEGWVEP
jgi:hypothetical protein